MKSITKEFDLATVLSITSGILFTDLDTVRDALNYLTSSQVFHHQIPSVLEFATPYVLSLYPQLKDIGSDIIINGFDEAKIFIDEQKKIYGEKLLLTPMSKNDIDSYKFTKMLSLAPMNGAVISTNKKPIVGTQSLAYCVGLLLYNEKEKKAIVAHVTSDIIPALEESFKLMVLNKLDESQIKYLIIDGFDTNNYITRNEIIENLKVMPDLFIPFSKEEIPVNAIKKNKDYEAMEFAFDSRTGQFVTDKVLFGSEYNEINEKKHQK